MNSESIVKEVISSLQDDKFEIGSRIHELLADDKSKNKYVVYLMIIINKSVIFYFKLVEGL